MVLHAFEIEITVPGARCGQKVNLGCHRFSYELTCISREKASDSPALFLGNFPCYSGCKEGVYVKEMAEVSMFCDHVL